MVDDNFFKTIALYEALSIASTFFYEHDKETSDKILKQRNNIYKEAMKFLTEKEKSDYNIGGCPEMLPENWRQRAHGTTYTSQIRNFNYKDLFVEDNKQ